MRCTENEKLVLELVKRKIPLTVCPLSNIKLQVFKKPEEHNLKKLLDLGINATVNSDDPAYFGGYINENLISVYKALKLSIHDIYKLVENSFNASFLPEKDKATHRNKLKEFIRGYDQVV